MRIIALAKEYGRYGYRMIWVFMQAEGWKVNHKFVYRVWPRHHFPLHARVARHLS